MFETYYAQFDHRMKFTSIFIILTILFCIYIPYVSAQADDNPVNGIANVTLAVPTTGSAILGTKESMNEYQIWLDERASQIVAYANSILNLLGVSGFNWNQTPPAIPTETTVPTVQITAVPTLTIPESPYRTTLITVTGSNGQTASDTFSVDGPYWELWYTADPLTTGGQDIASPTGSYSEVFPTLSIQVVDKTDPDKVIETIEPPGGLDKTLWEKSGIDPRPWMQYFYEGYKEYYFVITATNLKSYIVEARVPNQAAEKLGSVAYPETPTPASTPQRTYIVAANVFRVDSGIRVIYEGGRDAASLQYITIIVNGAPIGEMGSEDGQTLLPIETAETFPVNDTGSGFYVIGTGHFAGGATQKIFETTL